MNKQFLLVTSIAFLLCSCGSDVEPAVSSSSEAITTPQTSSITSSSSSQQTSSSKESSSSKEESSSSQTSTTSYDYSANPMKEPYIGRQYYLNHIGDIYNTWKSYRGDGQTIAVIDEGFKANHEDFYYADGTSKVSKESASFVTSGSKTTVSVGVDKVDAGEASHGTFCAGVAAAAINGKGVVGVAPNAGLLLLKTDRKPKSIVQAFKYAADHGATVITISIGSYSNYEGDLVNDGSDLTKVFDEPVKYCIDKGIPVISAGGNGGGSANATKFTYPGGSKNVIGCGGLAANSSGTVWSGSSYNSSSSNQFIDVLAPSDMMFGCCNYGGKKYDAGWDGTSFASPQVAGIAALYKQKYPNSTVAQFEKALYDSCHKINSSVTPKTNQLGYGRVDVGKLLGTNITGNLTITVKSKWTNCCVYAWSEEKQTELKAWPGTKMSKSDTTFTFTIDAGTYDSLLINDGTDSKKSPDLLTSSFSYSYSYSLTSTTSESGVLVGSYVK